MFKWNVQSAVYFQQLFARVSREGISGFTMTFWRGNIMGLWNYIRFFSIFFGSLRESQDRNYIITLKITLKKYVSMFL